MSEYFAVKTNSRDRWERLASPPPPPPPPFIMGEGEEGGGGGGGGEGGRERDVITPKCGEKRRYVAPTQWPYMVPLSSSNVNINSPDNWTSANS